ncbi:MAG: response regulator [Chloroflexota bacterium]
MVLEAKPTLLIVEDDLDVTEMLNAYFDIQGFDVLVFNWGEDGVRACREKQPDLIILDIRLPDIDGYEVANRLRSDERTADIPIIFLTEKGGRVDRMRGLELGAVDYVTKPFDIQELRLRVRNALRRTPHDSATNPITNLPEGKQIDEHLEACLDQHEWALVLVSLRNLGTFREQYGFAASDNVLRGVSLIIHSAVRELGTPDDFLGHITATDFVIITIPKLMPVLSEHIKARLEQSLSHFYPIEDRNTVEFRDKSLLISVGHLLSPKEPFTDLDVLKTTLLRQRH